MDFLPWTLREALARILILVLALLILWLFVRIVTRLLTTPIRRLLRRSGYSDPDRVVNVLTRLPKRFLLGAVVLMLAVVILEMADSFEALLRSTAATLLIISIVLLVNGLIGFFFFTSSQLRRVTGFNIDDGLLPFLKTVLKLLTFGIGALFVLQAWDVDVGALIAGLGIAGLAVSLAAQDTIANMFGFVVIMADRPFVVGEWVKTPDCEGTVEEVRLRSTRVRQLDQSLVMVPNSKMASASVVNWSRLGKRLINVTFGITNTTAPEDLESLLVRLREVLLRFPAVEVNSVQVHFVNIGAQSLEVLVRAYLLIVDMSEFRAEQERILLALKREVDMMQLKISGPSQTLYLQNLEKVLPGLARPEPNAPPAAGAGQGDRS
ncbi:MAG: mechanosensitive ion channel family protein [Anaerolineae bacterium]|nr:mechanosensitive ion channel family protein [Anaerolineae bacterium]